MVARACTDGLMPRPHRVLDINVSQCPRSGGALRVLAVITDHRVITAMLYTGAHIDTRATRAPPPFG
jgi:hypothetical protein